MDPLRRGLRQSADALVHRLARVGVQLGYEREGVDALDRYVDDNRGLWSPDDRERLATELAAFVGEAMVATYALSWRVDKGTPSLALPDGDTASPLQAAHARLDGDERLTSFFDRIGDALTHARR
ncbi:MAG TPA: hypothetical protein VG755_20490 [Nannocystaceae bacterium]|nr:hypothetical protein [Nannocystaceae bacterium]